MPPEIMDESVETTEVESTEQVESQEESHEEDADQVETDPGEEVSEEEESSEEASNEEGEEEAEQVAQGEKPNLSYRAAVFNKDTKEIEQKEFQIGKEFLPLMKDPKTATLVRELHEKASGVDSIKERLNEQKSLAQNYFQENTTIKHQVQEARSIYQRAVNSGNLHNLDMFFDKLNIPQDVVLSYALAKVQLSQMDPAQQQAIMGQINADRKSYELEKNTMSAQELLVQQSQQLKTMQIQVAFNNPEVIEMEKAFDERAGKVGAFREAVVQTGEYTYLKDKVDLTPEQAIQKVVQQFNLKASPLAKAQPQGMSGTKPVVQRTNQVIPNVSSKSASPIARKPTSIEDIQKYRKETYGF